MTDFRRTILWVVFTMSLVLLWDNWNKYQGRPSMFGAPPASTASAPAGSAGPASAPGAAATGVPAPSAAVNGAGAIAAGPPAVAGAQETPREQIVVTTDLVKATLDTQGGTPVRLELLQQQESVKRKWYEPLLELFSGAGKQQDKRNVVLFDESKDRVYMAQTGLIGSASGFPTHKTGMTLTPGPRELKDGQQALVVRFESPEVGGVKYVKTYTFQRGRYDVAVQHDVVNVSAAALTPQLYLQLVRDGNPPPGESAFYFTFTGPALYTDAKKFQKVEFSDIEKSEASYDSAADNGWVAMVQHYFASAWLVGDKAQREFFARRVDANLYAVGMIVPLQTLDPGAVKSVSTVLYAGPQEEKKLEQLAPGLELVKDYGWLTILAKPLFWLLDQLNSLFGNWGWAIVGLVVLIKIAFYGLNASAYRSMAKMKAVSPRVTELRERYKDKPQQMQQEMMRIYREEKVNPMGGCLPILVQIPVFIALYWVLLSSVEMRNAPWIGWIKDLSVLDPYYILPLLMTATTMFQTWLNPTPPDPVQAKMMWIMPLVFSVMFFVFPAGLVLYWLTNNVLSIAQQWWINKRLGVLNIKN